MRRAAWCGALLLALAGTAARAAGDTAMLTDVTGPCRLVTAEQKRPCDIFDALDESAQLELARGAHAAWVYLDAVAHYDVSGPARVRIGHGAPVRVDGNTPVRRAARATSLATGAELNSSRLELTAAYFRALPALAPPALQLRRPLGKVLAARPVFDWSATPPLASYHLLMVDAASGTRLHEAQVSDTHYALPPDVVLQAGGAYAWQVEGPKADGGVLHADGEFVLASAVEAQALAAAQPAVDAPFSDRLVYALLLQRRGYAGEARTLLDTLAAERPQSAHLQALALPRALPLLSDDEWNKEQDARASAPPPRALEIPDPNAVPRIRIVQPAQVDAVTSPVTIELKFEAGPAPVDPASFRVYYGFLGLDITDRLRKVAEVKPDGIFVPGADLPVGSHKLKLQIADTAGHVNRVALSFTVKAPAH